MKLILDTEKCTGCKICELVCSANHQGVFNPQKAHLKIIDNYITAGREIGLKTCTLCMSCVKSCPVEAISYNSKWLVVSGELCNGCGQCISVCPEGIIYLNNEGIAAVPDFCEGNPYCIEWCPHQAIRKEEEVT
jgi:carbon-monoxide dehydrogenase iron sulfur subunit